MLYTEQYIKLDFNLSIAFNNFFQQREMGIKNTCPESLLIKCIYILVLFQVNCWISVT